MTAPGDKERQEGRGRLSSIDMLPEEAEPDILWALEQLRERSTPAKMILVEFNARLADRGLAPVSKSAWGRWSIRKAIQFRRLDEARHIASELVPSLGTDGPDHVTMMIAEMVKVSALELLEGGDVSSKGLMELSRAVSSAVAAQKVSAENRRKLEVEVEQRLAKAAAAVAEVGTAAGVGPDTLKKITNLLTTGQA
ncbi:phage protein Gp27 family protein [Sphingopyxis sp. LARHCG72]